MKSSKLVIALDIGTTSTRAIVFDAAGRIVSTTQRPTKIVYPRSGWVEQDARELWEGTRAVLRAAIRNVDVRRVAAIGVTNQRETVIIWDRQTGRPFAPAIVWQDRRTAAACAALRATGAERAIRRATGLVLDPYFTATKLAWLIQNNVAVRRAIRSGRALAGTVDSWIIWNLTGGRVHATDPSNASRTMLMDLRTLRWSPTLLRRFGIPRAILPEIRSSDGDFGATDPAAYGACIPIRAVLGDQQAALFGQGCWKREDAKYTFGTGGFLLVNAGSRPHIPSERLLATVAWLRGRQPTYAIEVSAYTAGASVGWLRDVGIIRNPAESERLAVSVSDSGGVIFIPALTGLGAPHWRPEARGAFLGLSRATTRAHLIRAVLEAVAFQAAEAIIVASVAVGRIRKIRVDGKAAENDFLLQLFANASGCVVERPAAIEATAFGAALLAGIASGAWRDRPIHARVRRFIPRVDREFRKRFAAWRVIVARWQ
ncbi:MAG: glycerol kinase GlpK [Candidatus Uhrbacteria bacterium]